MKASKELITATLIAGLLLTPITLRADDDSGAGYEQSSYLSLSPEWALGGLAVVAIAAVCLQNSSGGHAH